MNTNNLKIVQVSEEEFVQAIDESVRRNVSQVLGEFFKDVKTGHAPLDAKSRWVTKAALAKELEVDLSTIRNWEKDGRITGFRAPGSTRVYFDRDEIDSLLSSKAGKNPKAK